LCRLLDSNFESRVHEAIEKHLETLVYGFDDQKEKTVCQRTSCKKEPSEDLRCSDRRMELVRRQEFSASSNATKDRQSAQSLCHEECRSPMERLYSKNAEASGQTAKIAKAHDHPRKEEYFSLMAYVK